MLGSFREHHSILRMKPYLNSKKSSSKKLEQNGKIWLLINLYQGSTRLRRLEEKSYSKMKTLDNGSIQKETSK